jgi:hypothetical protein
MNAVRHFGQYQPIAKANETGERRTKELEKASASKPPAEELLARTSGLLQLRKFFAYIGKSRHAIINSLDVVTCFVVVIS